VRKNDPTTQPGTLTMNAKGSIGNSSRVFVIPEDDEDIMRLTAVDYAYAATGKLDINVIDSTTT
jgi:hypothetical protein